MDKEVHTFPEDINPKVNIIARLEFEPTYYDLAVQPFIRSATGLPTELLILLDP